MALILLVDDDQNLREVLRLVLEAAGHDVVEAADGRECVAIYREKRPALVVLDVFMPHQDGIETLIRLQREFDDVKVIAMSGGGGTSPRYRAWTELSKLDALETARLLGAKLCLAKPFDAAHLVEAIDRVLSGT